MMYCKDDGKKNIVNYRILGNSGLRVFPICLGTMGFGNNWEKMGLRATEEEAEKILKTYMEAGGNFIDTASVYQDGQSEIMIGKLLKKLKIDRERLIIATKFTAGPSFQNVSDPNAFGNAPKSLRSSLETSLKRMQLDYVDILYVHWWDWSTPIQTMMKYLDDVVRSGKVLHIAISDCPAWVVAKANQYAEDHGLHQFCCYQGNYSLIERSLEQEVVPMCREFEMSLCPWGILQRGALTGIKEHKDMERKAYLPNIDEKVKKVQEKLVELAKKYGYSAACIAANWVMHKPGVGSAISGSRTNEQWKDILNAVKFKLEEEDVKALDLLTKDMPPHHFPITYSGTSFETCRFNNGWPTKYCTLEKTKY